MRRSLISAAGVICLAMGAIAQQAPAAVGQVGPMGKVGVISVQGAIVGTKDGQKASQELDARFTPKKKEFDSRQAEISQLQDQYNKGGTVMNEDKRQQLARDIDEKKKRLQRDMQDAQDELQGEQQKLLQGLGQRMMAVIEKYAKDNGYTMILDVSNPNTPVLYASSAIDITQDIVALYDKTSTNGGPATTPTVPGAVRPNPTPGTVKPSSTPGPGPTGSAAAKTPVIPH
ncbi:MAG: OmpH family outer membrane protein [Acidobacteriaceae bacterium]|nr:OmpH family outer membrane protein [Acidobacteriaceae bacterium]MBV9502221.1 OmpH family outer membrane protein [Acidobacteriaceae bacterium]